MCDPSKECVKLFSVHTREKLTNSIRLQWRRLKSHVERLDSQGSRTVARPPRSQKDDERNSSKEKKNTMILSQDVKEIEIGK